MHRPVKVNFNNMTMTARFRSKPAGCVLPSAAFGNRKNTHNTPLFMADRDRSRRFNIGRVGVKPNIKRGVTRTRAVSKQNKLRNGDRTLTKDVNRIN